MDCEVSSFGHVSGVDEGAAGRLYQGCFRNCGTVHAGIAAPDPAVLMRSQMDDMGEVCMRSINWLY